MTSEPNGIGRALFGGLRLSSDEALQRAKEAEAERSDYRRRYWQKYSKRVRRVFGTITPEEYAEVAARAVAVQGGEPSVWRQIWLESRAYIEQSELPTSEIAEQQSVLISELRRIGNNINQLARLGHVQASRARGLTALADDRLGIEALRQFERLEQKVARFEAATAPRKSKSTEKE